MTEGKRKDASLSDFCLWLFSCLAFYFDRNGYPFAGDYTFHHMKTIIRSVLTSQEAGYG